MHKIGEISNYFKVRLSSLYPEREVASLQAIVFEEVLGLSRADTILSKNEELTKENEGKIKQIIKELKEQKPIQYIMSFTDFYGLRYFVNEDVLIPRQETEELVDLIIRDNRQKKNLKIIDIGTGSGCIAICLKKHLPESLLTAIDISEGALVVAQKNAQTYNTDVQFKKMDILDESKWDRLEAFDLIVSNPPYVREVEKLKMKKNVLENEPANALFVSNEEPLVFYKALSKLSQKKLKQGGKIYMEINEVFGEEVSLIFKNSAFSEIKIIKDLHKKNRFVRAEKV